MMILINPTGHLKNMIVKLDYFPRDPGKNKKYLKPPPIFAATLIPTKPDFQ